MSWEDDELAAYEDTQNKRVMHEYEKQEGKKYLDKYATKVWIELRKAFTDKCTELNQKAKREMFTSTNPYVNNLFLDRDGTDTLEGVWEPTSHRIKFSSESCQPCNREYGLKVHKAADGKFSTVWVDIATQREIKPDEIVKQVLTAFMRS